MGSVERVRVGSPHWFRVLGFLGKRFALLEVLHSLLSPLSALGASLPGFIALPLLFLAKEKGFMPPQQAWTLAVLLGYVSAVYFFRRFNEVLSRPSYWRGVYAREAIASFLVAYYLFRFPPTLEEVSSPGDFDPMRFLGPLLGHPFYWLVPAFFGAYKLLFLFAWSKALRYASQEDLSEAVGLPPLEGKNDSLSVIDPAGGSIDGLSIAPTSVEVNGTPVLVPVVFALSATSGIPDGTALSALLKGTSGSIEVSRLLTINVP